MFQNNISHIVSDAVAIDSKVNVERFSNGLVYTNCAHYESLIDFVVENGFTWTDKGFINLHNGVQATWVDYRGLYHCSWMSVTK